MPMVSPHMDDVWDCVRSWPGLEAQDVADELSIDPTTARRLLRLLCDRWHAERRQLHVPGPGRRWGYWPRRER